MRQAFCDANEILTEILISKQFYKFFASLKSDNFITLKNCRKIVCLYSRTEYKKLFN